MLIVRWILNEEDIDENDTYSELDRITCIVQESLRGNDSSTNSTAPLEERMPLSNEEIATVTHPTACLRILDCLKHVLYQQLQFKGNVDEYYKKDNSMLHQVRYCHKVGIRLVVLFIYFFAWWQWSMYDKGTSVGQRKKSESLTEIKPMIPQTLGGCSIYWATRTHGEQSH